MHYKVVKRHAFLCMIVFVFTLSWFFQSSLLLNTDVSWLLEASKRMLSGGNYTNDFFENNPPWILYFYTPPVLFEKIFSISIILSMRMYVFLLAAISLGISHYLLKHVFLKADIFLAKLLLVILAIVFLIFPMADFGQREHLLFLLMMPYFFMMALRLQDQQIAHLPAFIIGLLAGSVLMMKPYFFMTLILVEGYYLLGASEAGRRDLTRPEIFAIILLLIIYLTILFLRHADYLNRVMPFALRWCYLGARRPWAIVLVNIPTISCLLSFFFYIATYDINRYKYLTNILLLGLLGFIFSYVIQQEDYPYHILPATSASIIIDLILLGIYTTTPGKPGYIYVFMGIFLLIISVFINNIKDMIYFDIMLHPLIFLCYLTSVFVSIRYLNVEKNKRNYLMMTLLGILIFFIPFYDALLRYDLLKKRQVNSEKLIAYINSNAPHQSIYFFTTNIAHAFPIITYSHDTTSSSRFSYFWALPGLLKQSSLPMDNKLQSLLSKDKNFLIDMVADDLSVKKPELVFIDVLDRKNSLGLIPFNYLDYFAENQKFNTVWKNYRYLTTISASTYKFSIYNLEFGQSHMQ